MTHPNWNQLMEDHEVTYLRADVCIGSPESYTLEEKRKICEDIDASNAEMEAALKADFESMPPQMQACMLELLASADSGNMGFWKRMLGLSMRDAPPAIT